MGRLLAITAALFALTVSAADITVTAYPVNDTDVKVDGVPEESVWKKIPATGDFVRVYGSGKIAYQTRAKVLYSNKYLYFGITAEMPDGFKPEKMSVWAGDRVEIAIRPNPGESYYYTFSLSACEVREDCANADPEYDTPADFSSGWETAVKVNKNNWTAEIKIPFGAFAYDPVPKSGTQWLINFCRGQGNGAVIYSALNPEANGFHNAVCKLNFK